MTLLRLLPRFRKAYQAFSELAERETWGRRNIEDFQTERLNAVWRHAITNVPYYRDIKTKKGLPETFSSPAEFVSTVPVLKKDAIIKNPRSFFSERPRPGFWDLTGGSTGEPMRVYWEHEAHREMLRTQYRYYAEWGVDIFDRSVFLWGHRPSVPQGLSGLLTNLDQSLKDRFRNRMRLSAYHMSPGDLRDYLRRIHAFQPVSVYGFSFALYLLAREAEKVDFHCDSLKLFTLTGEPASTAILEKVEKVFRAPASLEYGSRECGKIAFTRPDRKLYVREDVCMIETPRIAEGYHEILVTVLNNPSFPLLRYAVGDATDEPLEGPDKGFSILSGVAGRNNDVITSRSGRYMHPTLFLAVLKYYMNVIRRYHLHQGADGAITIQVELENTREELNPNGLKKHVGDLTEGYPVTIEIVDSIPRTIAGKHRVVTSEVSNLTFGKAQD